MQNSDWTPFTGSNYPTKGGLFLVSIKEPIENLAQPDRTHPAWYYPEHTTFRCFWTGEKLSITAYADWPLPYDPTETPTKKA